MEWIQRSLKRVYGIYKAYALSKSITVFALVRTVLFIVLFVSIFLIARYTAIRLKT